MLAVFSLNYGSFVSAMEWCTPEESQLLDMCARNDFNGVVDLVAKGVNVNCSDKYGRRPLFIACQLGYKNIVVYLVEHGADVYAQNEKGFIPSRVAFQKGFLDIVDYLIGIENELWEMKHIKSQKLNKKGRKQKNKITQNVQNSSVAQVSQFQPTVKSVQPKKLSRKEKKAQNKIASNAQKNVVVQVPQQQSVNQNKNLSGKNNNVKIMKTDSAIHIYEYSKDPRCYTETILYRDCENCLSPGVYYKTQNGLERVQGVLRSNDGIEMYNPLRNLTFTEHVLQKMHDDNRHNFSQVVDEEAGIWARVVIDNPIQNSSKITESKRFNLSITIPGEIVEINGCTGKEKIVNRLHGVFEFGVSKKLYKPKGKCTHRFFAPKGTVGAQGFGAEFREKEQRKLAKGLLTDI